MTFFEPWEATVEQWSLAVTRNICPGSYQDLSCSSSESLLYDSISSGYAMSESSHASDEPFDDEVKAIAQELFLHKPPPPEGYVCDICKLDGHYKNMCPKIPNKESGCTPYQGTKKCYGEFICLKCKRKWVSYQSWANCAQQCVKCKIDVFPKKQKPLINSNTSITKHPVHLCKKCQSMGRNCNTTNHPDVVPTLHGAKMTRDKDFHKTRNTYDKNAKKQFEHLHHWLKIWSQ